MELTRRDAVRALVVGGGLGASGITVAEMRDATTVHAANDTEFENSQIKTTIAVIKIVYLIEVSVIAEFVEQHLSEISTDKTAEIARVFNPRVHPVLETTGPQAKRIITTSTVQSK